MRAVLVILALFTVVVSGFPAVYNLWRHPHHHHHGLMIRVVEGISREQMHEVVATADVRAVWRNSAIIVVESKDSSKLPPLPHGLNVSEPFYIPFGQRAVIALSKCVVDDKDSHVLYTQQDGSCVMSSLVPYEDLDQTLHREDILPSSHTRLVPQMPKPSFAVTKQLKDDRIAALLKLANIESQTAHLKSLTHDFNTRLSSTPELTKAAEWLKNRFTEIGLQARLFPYSTTYGPVVEAIFPGTGASDEIVIIGAHLDDRSKNINDQKVRAPGANDDGSGIAMLLEAALVLSKAGVKFSRSIHIMAFTGEEQGLHGSTAYATDLVNKKSKVAAMIQGDMLAVRTPGKQARMAIATMYSTDWMEQWIRDIAEQYVPELAVEVTNSCCTDQMPFYTRGYPAIAVNEGGGYLIDPMYHNTGDVVERADYSVEQITFITRVVLAAAATAAEVSA